MCLRNLSLRIQCGSLPRECVSMQFRVAAAWTRPVRGKSLAVLPKPRVSDHAKIAIEIGVHARRGNKWNQKREARSSNNRALPIHHHHHHPEHLRVSRWQCKRGVLGPRECLVCTRSPRSRGWSKLVVGANHAAASDRRGSGRLIHLAVHAAQVGSSSWS